MDDTNDTVHLATDLTIAWLSNHNNRVSADEVPGFLQTMFDTVAGLSGGGVQAEPAAEPGPEYTPAVTIRKSLASPEHILSMIDGKPYKTLKRHLATNGLTPDEYRQRYGLKADYPMVAPAYGEARRQMAHKIGLGRKPKANTSSEPASAAQTPEPTRRSRKGTAAGTGKASE